MKFLKLNKRGEYLLKTEDLVEHVRRTNPNMDKKKLIEELSKSDSSTAALIYEFVNHFGK